MTSITEARQWIERLLTQPGKEMGRWARFLRFQMQLWRFCARRLWANNVTAMSAALSFRTIFAMIPALVLTFLVLKSVGVLEDGKQAMHRFLEASGFGQIALVHEGGPDSAPASEDTQTRPARVINVAEEIEAVVARVEDKLTIGRLGPVGVVLLIWTAITLLTEMEQSLNRVFGAKRGRSAVRRLLLYWSAMTLGPIILAAAAFMGRRAAGAVEHATGLSWLLAGVGWIGPFALGVLVVAALYKLLSNADVGFHAAVGGALVAVPLWLIAKWGFSLYVQRFVVSGNLYGSLGLLPLFLIWLNVSWLIFLFGAELSHTAANLTELQSAETAEQTALGPADLFAAAVAVAQPYLAGQGPVDIDRIRSHIRLPMESVRALLDRLVSLGLVCPVQGSHRPAYVLARPANGISVADLLDLRQAPLPDAASRYDGEVAAAVAHLCSQTRAAIGSLTLDRFATGPRPQC